MKKLLGGFSLVKWLLLGVLFVAIVYFVGMSLARTYLPPPYKCWLMACELASWKEIQQIALKNARQHEVISDAAAFPKTNFKSADLGEVSIHITYADNSQPTGGMKQYTQRIVVFDDRMLWVRDLDMMMLSQEPASVEFQTQFLTTKLGPREAYWVVWDRLQTSPHLKNVLAMIVGLRYGEEASENTTKLVWSFDCLMHEGTLIYEVDAETGKLTYETVALH